MDRRGTNKTLNHVHQDAIHLEMVRKENRAHKPYTNFTINPFTKMYTVTGKPNSFLDAQIEHEQEDEVMKELIAMAQKPPTQKFTSPQTSAQEYGWISTPLLRGSRDDPRLYHPRSMTDVTATKEAEWKLMENTKTQ